MLLFSPVQLEHDIPNQLRWHSLKNSHPILPLLLSTVCGGQVQQLQQQPALLAVGEL
jgi:hypothetical protein